jgi:putative phosphoesterase
MKIGVISDSHNHLTNIQAAVSMFRQEGIAVLIHCGDMTTAETAAAIGEFRVIHATGNGDYASGEIRQALLRQNEQSFSELVYTGEIDGVPIAVTHGHLNGKVQELTHSGLYRYVFYGHSHRRRDESVGTCRVINPGALGGLKAEVRSALILDLHSGDCRFFFL